MGPVEANGLQERLRRALLRRPDGVKRCADLGNFLQQTGAMLFLHLLNRMNSAAKSSEQREFLLDLQQPFLPLPVSNMR